MSTKTHKNSQKISENGNLPFCTVATAKIETFIDEILLITLIRKFFYYWLKGTVHQKIIV